MGGRLQDWQLKVPKLQSGVRGVHMQDLLDFASTLRYFNQWGQVDVFQALPSHLQNGDETLHMWGKQSTNAKVGLETDP